MADIITTLHSENDESTNLYPNIIKENIPNNSIDITKLGNDVINLLSGLSKPKYVTTLPSNDEGLVVYTDGYLYSWDGTQYVNTNIQYQTSSVSEDGLPNQLSSLIKNSAINLMYTTTKTLDKFLNNNNQETTLNGFSYTDYIDVTGYNTLFMKIYSTSNTEIAYYGCFYDENKNFISYITHSGFRYSVDNGNRIIGIPKKVKYIRINCYYQTENIINSGSYCFLGNMDIEISRNNKLNLYNSLNLKATDYFCYLNNSGTIIYNQQDFRISDYFDLTNVDKVYLRFSANSVHQEIVGCYFDENKTFVSSINSNIGEEISDGLYEYNIPVNAKYVRFNVFSCDILNAKNNNIAFVTYKNDTNNDIKYLYGDTILKPIDFNNKKLLAFGDSIMYGISSPNNVNVGNNKFISLFASKFNMTLVNKAVSGTCITYSADQSGNSIVERVLSTTQDADVIIIAGGTNDYNSNKPLGTYGDTTNNTFYGALHVICEYLTTNYSTSDIIFLTPINVTKNVNNIPKDRLNLYRNAIYEMATKYKYNVVNGIDLVKVNGLGGWNNTMIADTDGTHPTELGHYLYYVNLCNKLC